MRAARCAWIAVCLGGASLAHGAVVPIGEFTGDAFEGFENIIPPGPHTGPMPIFGGSATFDDNFVDPWIVNSLSTSPPLDELMLAYNGNLMGLTPTGWTVFEFDTPIVRFGGYFGMLSDVAGGNVSFLDAQGATVETLDFEIPRNEWTWRGWSSDEPISSVVVHLNANPGFATIFDDMQVTYVPEPVAAMALGGLGLLAWRRR